CQMPNAKCQMPNAKCQMPNAKGQRPKAKGQRPKAKGQRPKAKGILLWWATRHLPSGRRKRRYKMPLAFYSLAYYA
ncbi:hypothetical protein, partial [Pectobacterium aroidearum]|uniref:hypothetical protein n=1 Tax=Pectobacterium aroidearum TaxID=1201031 RepID=UPI001C6972C0